MNKAYDSGGWHVHLFSGKIEVKANSRIDRCAHRGSGYYVVVRALVRPHSWDSLFS